MSNTTAHLCPVWEGHFTQQRLDKIPAAMLADFARHRQTCPTCQQVPLDEYIMQQSLALAAGDQATPLELPPQLVRLWDEQDEASAHQPAADALWHASDQPAMLVDPFGEHAHHAYFGFQLDAMQPTSHANLLSTEALLLGRLSFMRSSMPGVSFAVEVRYLFTPPAGDQPARVAVYLLARYADWRLEGDRLRDQARRFSDDLATLIFTTFTDHQFRPVTDEHDLRAIIAPFAIGDTAEIRRASVLPYGIPIVFGGVPDSETLVDVLLEQAEPALLAMTIEPTDLDRIYNTLDENMLLPDTEAVNPDHVISMLPEERIASALQERRPDITKQPAFIQRVQSLRTHAYLIRIQAASRGALNPALMATLNTEFGGPSKALAQTAWHSSVNPGASTTAIVRPHTASESDGVSEFDRAARNLTGLAFDLWQSDRASDYLCDLGEAARLLPLPTAAHWLASRGLALQLPFREPPQPGIRLGVNRHKGRVRPVTQPFASRTKHTWIVGQTGTGKSTLLESMILQDIHNDQGTIVIDPHGELIGNVLSKIPKRRLSDVILFDPADTDRPLGINIIQAKNEDEKAIVVSSLLQLLQKMFDPNYLGIVGPRFEHGVRNGLLTILCAPEGATLIELVRVLTDQNYVRRLLPYISDPIVRRYWTDQIANTNDFHRSEVLDWLVSKFGRFVTDYTVRRIIGQVQSSFSFREAIDGGKIVLLSLAKGKVGSANANFLGLILLPMILQAALSRTNLEVADRRQCTLYIDEFQNYATESLALMLAEARKYQLSLVLANQHVGQITDEIREALFGNVGSIISFRVGAADALLIERLFEPSPVTTQLVTNLPDFTAYSRILINNRRTPAFTLETELPPYPANPVIAERIRIHSRVTYGRDRRAVDDEILHRSQMG